MKKSRFNVWKIILFIPNLIKDFIKEEREINKMLNQT